ncbi:hypothetical protein RhiLY_11091 [Ceratobasidium sp. AG-Ba]|nr:hypothetical protein RhiLY_11091 [Ceratobasidium sp. AG-Ba]
MIRPPYGPQIVREVPPGGVVIPPVPDRGQSRASGRSQIVVPPALSDSNVPYPVHSSSEESSTISSLERSFIPPPLYGRPPQSEPVIPEDLSTTDESTFESTNPAPGALPPHFEASRPPSSESFVIPPPASSSGAPALPSAAPSHAPSIAPSQAHSHASSAAPSEAGHPDIIIIEPGTRPVSPRTPSEMYGPEVIQIAPAPAPTRTSSGGTVHQVIEVIAPATERAESVVEEAPQVIRVSSPAGSQPATTPQIIRVGSPAESVAQVIRVGSPAAGQPQVVRLGSPAVTQPQIIRVATPRQAPPQRIRVTSPAASQPQIIRVASPPHVVRVGSPTSSFAPPQVIRVTSPRTAAGPQIIRVGSTRPRVRRDSRGSDYVAIERPGHGRSPSRTTRVASPPTVVVRIEDCRSKSRGGRSRRSSPTRRSDSQAPINVIKVGRSHGSQTSSSSSSSSSSRSSSSSKSRSRPPTIVHVIGPESEHPSLTSRPHTPARTSGSDLGPQIIQIEPGMGGATPSTRSRYEGHEGPQIIRVDSPRSTASPPAPQTIRIEQPVSEFPPGSVQYPPSWQPIPGQPGVQYPIQPGVPYPIQPGAPYPAQPGVQYPGQPGVSYPGHPGAPYPGQPGQPYPPGQWQQPPIIIQPPAIIAAPGQSVISGPPDQPQIIRIGSSQSSRSPAQIIQVGSPRTSSPPPQIIQVGSPGHTAPIPGAIIVEGSDDSRRERPIIYAPGTTRSWSRSRSPERHQYSSRSISPGVVIDRPSRGPRPETEHMDIGYGSSRSGTPWIIHVDDRYRESSRGGSPRIIRIEDSHSGSDSRSPQIIQVEGRRRRRSRSPRTVVALVARDPARLESFMLEVVALVVLDVAHHGLSMLEVVTLAVLGLARLESST